MSQLLDFMFEENGDLKDEFRRYPTPQKDGATTNYADKSVTGPWATRIERWEEQNLDRIPDWEKVLAFLDARELVARHSR